MVSPRTKAGLGLEPEEFRHLAHAAVDIAADYLAEVRLRPVFRPMAPGRRLALLGLHVPAHGVDPERLLQLTREQIMSFPMGNGHPRFFGWVNSPPSAVGIVAELLAATMNPSCAGGDHAAIYLERASIRMLMELVGFPTDGSIGLLVSGGSTASLTALAAARYRAALQDGWDVRAEGFQGGRAPLIMYVSEEGHSCLRKAAELLGIGTLNVRTVSVDDCFRMDVGALRTAIAADRAAKRRPFCVVASAGTVNTGAIDPLALLADLCGEERLWLHVDGAYGAVGILDPEVAPRYEGLARADSLALDPHKWLSVPVECGAVLVRDGQLLRNTFSLVPPYLRTEEGKGFGGLPWFSEYGFQQTRGFRALKLWMTLEHAGRDGLAEMIAHHNRLARRLASHLEAAEDFELLARPELSIVCFRYVPKALRGDDMGLDALNKAIVERVQAEGEVFLSSTMLRGRFALRACVLHYDATEADIEVLMDVIRRTGRELNK